MEGVGDELLSTRELLPEEIWLLVLGRLDVLSVCRVAGLDTAMRELIQASDDTLFRRFWQGSCWAVDTSRGYRDAIFASRKLRRGDATEVGASKRLRHASWVQALGNGSVIIGGDNGVTVMDRHGISRKAGSTPIAFFGHEPLSNRELIAVSTHRSVGILDSFTGFHLLFRFGENDGEALDTAAPPDGQFIAVGFSSGVVRLAWRNGRELCLRMSEPADCLACARGVVAAASFTAPTKVLVWCAETGTVLQRFDACTGGFDLANIGGIEMLNPKCVLIWDSRRVLYEAFVENGFVRRLAETNSTGAHIERGKVCVSPDGSKVVAAGAKAAILVNLRTGHVEKKLDAHYALVRFTPDGKFVVAAQGKPHAVAYSDISELPYLMIFDASTGELRRKIRMQGTLKQLSVAGSTIAGVQRVRKDSGKAVTWQFS